MLVVDLVSLVSFYLSLVPFLRVTSRSDLDILKVSANGQGILTGLLSPLLGYEPFLVEKAQSKVNNPRSKLN